jgi:hypothetical protein
MDSKVVSWLACAAIAAVLVWFAIWSGGGNSGSSESVNAAPQTGQPASSTPVADQSSIEQVLRRVFSQNDSKQCTETMTIGYRRQMFGSSKGTLDRCRRSNTPQADPATDGITVESITATGSAATAVFKASGGSMDGSVVTVSMVQEGGRWKLNRLADIQIDRARLDQRVKNELGARGYLPSETSCAIAKFDRTASNADIERDTIVRQSSVDIDQLAASCLTRSTLLRELGQDIAASLHAVGFRGQVVNCVVDRMTHGVPTERLRHLVAAGARGAEGWARIAYEAAAACAGTSGGAPASSSTT